MSGRFMGVKKMKKKYKFKIAINDWHKRFKGKLLV